MVGDLRVDRIRDSASAARRSSWSALAIFFFNEIKIKVK
jgi:hypothetical protein